MKQDPQVISHGGKSGVTGSCHELSIGDQSSILVDCGLFQGEEARSGELTHEIDFPIDHIQALIVTHCHLDHVGRIPYLLAAGYNKPIFCSEATAALLPLTLEDALKVGVTRNQRLIKACLKKIDDLLAPIPYGVKELISEGFRGSESVSIKLKPAGHILGSAVVEIFIGQGRSQKKVIFSGDLGAPYTPLLPAPKSPYSADVLVLESTYGDRVHEGRKQRRDVLRRVIEKCFENRGTVLIPAFSIGRTQELLYELETIIHRYSNREAAKGIRWDDIDVIVDSPLAARFTEKYKSFSAYWDKEAKRVKRAGRYPLSFEQALTIDSHQEHLRTVEYLKSSGRPAIVIAASGMCSGGRIMNYLKALIEDPRTDVLFVGYQARGTPGAAIQEYGPKNGYVVLDNQRYTINAGVYTISGYSAHADRDNLVRFIKGMRKKPGEIRLVHGDLTARKSLKKKLETEFPQTKIHM